MRNIWDKIMGYHYIVNLHTHKVHKLDDLHHLCGVDKITSEHRWKISKHQLLRYSHALIKCHLCFKHERD